jgi:hypothetical protein
MTRRARERTSLALAGSLLLAACANAPPARDVASATDAPSRIEVEIPEPGGLVATAGAIWVQSGIDGSLWKISSTGDVILRIPHVASNPELFHPGVGGGGNHTIVAAFGSLWSLAGDSLFRIDPSTGEILAEIAVPQTSTSIASGSGALWVICNACFLRIDPEQNEVTDATDIETSPGGVAVGLDSVWISLISEAGGVLRIDPATLQPREAIHGQGFYNPAYMLVVGDELWTTDRDGSLRQVDPASGQVLIDLEIPPPIVGIAANDTTMWINAADLMVYDIPSAELHSIAHMGYTEWANGGVAAGFGYVWASSPEFGKVVAVKI